MNKALQERENLRKSFLETARNYVESLSKRYQPITAVVYGSVARGDFNLWSDIDLMIITDGLPQHPLKRAEVLYEKILPGLEPKGYTLAEFTKMRANGHPFIRRVLEEGIPIRDDYGIIHQE